MLFPTPRSKLQPVMPRCLNPGDSTELEIGGSGGGKKTSDIETRCQNKLVYKL
jgi:hypothetical protein